MYIHITKATDKTPDKYRLFGSLPIMCEECYLSLKDLKYAFRDGKNVYEDKVVKIVRIELERGGKKEATIQK